MGSSSVTERKVRMAALAYGGAKVSLIGKEKRRRRRRWPCRAPVLSQRRIRQGDPRDRGGLSQRPRPPSTRAWETMVTRSL